MKYAKPFALLEVDELLAGRREVWTSTHGRASRYHVMVEDGMAACRPNPLMKGSGMILCEQTLIPIGEVPGFMTCGRNGCRQWFETAIQ